MPTVIFFIMCLCCAGELFAREASLVRRAAQLFNVAIVSVSLSSAVVAHAEPVNTAWQDVRVDDINYRRTVFHLRTSYRGVDYVLHLVYIGSDKDGEKVFVGILPQSLRADEPLGREVRQVAEYSLYNNDGLIAEDLELEGEDFYPVEDSGEILAVDVVVGMFSGLDMSDYRPVVLDEFPDTNNELELLNYHPVREPHVLRWKSCQAGKYSFKTKLANHTCRLPWRPQEQVISSLGAPIFSHHGRLVGFSTMQVDNRQRHIWPTDKSVVFTNNMLRYIPIPQDVTVDDSRLSTTWANLKQDNK